MEERLKILIQVPGRQYLLPLIFLEKSQRTLPGNYGEDVRGPLPGSWKRVSSTFTPSSWSSPRGLYQVLVTMEKKLEVLDQVPGRQYRLPLHHLPGVVPEVSTR
jgi:hypothetical protein